MKIVRMEGRETDIDSVSRRDELFINAPLMENGDLIIP